MSDTKEDILQQNLAYAASEPETRAEKRFDQRYVFCPTGQTVQIVFRHLYDTYIIRNENVNGNPVSVTIGAPQTAGNVPYNLRGGEWVRLPAVDHRLNVLCYFGSGGEYVTIIAESGWSQIGFSSGVYKP